MADWQDFIDGLDLAGIVPDELARYRPAVADGLAVFLAGLEPARTAWILAEQLSLPSSTPTDARLVALARHCPALHKLGQVLARDRRLPPRLRGLLQHLETMSPVADGDGRLRATLERELGPLASIGITLDGPPLAEASVAVVVPFVWWESAAARPRRGVFKVLKPGIEARLDAELDLLQAIGARLDDNCRRLDLPTIAYEETFAQVRELLALEVRPDREQEHLRAGRAAYVAMDSVIVPEVFPFSTPRLTAMARIDGRKVTDVEGVLDAASRRRLADLVVAALIARPIWSPDPETLFHADPHAGNLMVTGEGELAIFDWSLVGRLSKDDLVALTQILLGTVAGDAPRIAAAITALSDGRIDGEALRAVVARSLGRLPDGRPWGGLSWLAGLMDDAVTAAGGRFRTDLMAFRKVLLTLRGVIADICADCDPEVALLAVFLRRFAWEWGWRAFAPPWGRGFSTHISNAELAELMMLAPLIAARAAWPRGRR
ncbi:MAG: AarF/UbiB family protein [Rhodospirillales bacterium]